MKNRTTKTYLLLLPLLFAMLSTTFAISGKPSDVTFADSAGRQWVYSFVTGNNGHLYASYGIVPGNAQWADLMLLPGTSSVSSLSAITWQSGGRQLIYVFGVGSNGHLLVNYGSTDLTTRAWEDQGLPPGASAIYNPVAVTYGAGLISVFVTTNTNRLAVNYYDGSGWNWADEGLPMDRSGVVQPTAITFLSGGTPVIYVFARSTTGHLQVNYGPAPPASRPWQDLGLPAGSFAVYNPSAITFQSGGLQSIYVYAMASNNHLVVCYWDGHGGWPWRDEGQGISPNGLWNPSAITYANGQVYVFAEEGGNARLEVRYGPPPPATPFWQDLDIPPGSNGFDLPSAITTRNGLIYVFGTSINPHNHDLAVKYWNGGWQWEDRGDR